MVRANCPECGAEHEYDVTPYLDEDGQVTPHWRLCMACFRKRVALGREIVREMVMNPDNEYEKKWAAGKGPVVKFVVELAKALMRPTLRN